MTTRVHPDPFPPRLLGLVTPTDHVLSVDNAEAINVELDANVRVAAGDTVRAERHEAGLYYRVNGTLVPLQ